MSGFNKTCIYCNKEIRLSNDTGRWLPYNLDNTAHECKKSSEQQQQTTTTYQTTRTTTNRTQTTAKTVWTVSWKNIDKLIDRESKKPFTAEVSR